MPRKFSLLIIFVLCYSSFSFAQENITITTYYPSPYGSFRELRAQKIAVGDNYSIANQYCWGTSCANRIYADLDEDGVFDATEDIVNLIVEGNVGIGTARPSAKLQVQGEALIGPPIQAAYTGLPFDFDNGKNALWINAYDAAAVYDYGLIYGEQNYAAGVRDIFRLNILSGDNRNGNPNQDDEVFIGNVNHADSTRQGLIVKSGNVGIGTVTPRTTQNSRNLRLDVTSNIITDDVYLSSPRSGSARWASESAAGTVQVANPITAQSVSVAAGVWTSVNLADVSSKAMVFLQLSGTGQFCAVRPRGDAANFPSHSGDYNTHGANQGMVDGSRRPVVICPTDNNGDIDIRCESAGIPTIRVLGYLPY